MAIQTINSSDVVRTTGLSKLNANFTDLDTRKLNKHTGKTNAPTVNDDINGDYLVSDIWIDENNNKSYICLDSTAGSALWFDITQSGGGGAGGIDTVKIAGIIEEGTEFYEYIADSNKTVGKITLALQVRPGGQNFIVTTYKNGTQTDTFTITTTHTLTNGRYKVTTDIAEALVDGDVFTAKVTQVGTTTKGAELSFIINIT